MSEETKPRMSLWLRLLLFGSLALNLLVVGLVAGAMVRFGKPGVDRPPRSVGTMLYRELPREDRRALWRESSRSGGDVKERRRAEGMAVTAALRQVPFDPDALSTVLTAQAAEREQFHRAVQDRWLARVTGMSDAERAGYADRLEHAMTRHHRKGEKKRDWGKKE